MLATAFRMISVAIFVVHILFVVSGEASMDAEDIADWTIENPEEWLGCLNEKTVKTCWQKGKCAKTETDILRNSSGRLASFKRNREICRHCFLDELKASKEKKKINGRCPAYDQFDTDGPSIEANATGVGKFAPPPAFRQAIPTSGSGTP